MASEEGLARLEQGAALLRKVPAQNFNILSWERTRAHSTFSADNVGSCGFAGCAMGWFANAKLFDGLELVRINHRVRVRYDYELDYAAASRLFGISERMAEYLFSPENYTDAAGGSTPEELRGLPPSVVADRMDRLIANLKATGEELTQE